MDNRILVYSANKGFKISKRKVFKGHYTSGYAIQVRRAHRRCGSIVSHAIGAQPSFSPCGSYLMSGDASGSLYFWDWATTRVRVGAPTAQLR